MIYFLIIIAIIAWIIGEAIFYFTHQQPLTEYEIKQLANKRKFGYVRTKYKFTSMAVSVNPDFKRSLNPNGQFYKVCVALPETPSLIAALLKSKKHEWIVHAIEKNGEIICLWANKGINNKSVRNYLGLDSLIKVCKGLEGECVLEFHNHPNSNPQLYNNLFESEQDKISANEYGKSLSTNGINFLAFVCERGRFRKYYMSISPMFYPDVAKIENIVKENGISKHLNYKLHRELGLIFREYAN